MTVEVVLPKWGMTMQDGTIVEWQVEVGQEVTEGQVLVSVATEKVDADVEAPASGKITEILVPAGETVPVGTVIGRISAP